jgi:sulfane dehydrogenase subunit SoxC
VLGLAGGLVGAGLVGRRAWADTPVAPVDPSTVLGSGTTAVAERSPFVSLGISPVGVVTGTAFAPLEQFTGSITPTDVQFQRHHAGIAIIDPARWKLLVHGLVERPLVFTLEDLKRFPAVVRTHFLECAGNGRRAFRNPTPDLTPQFVDGQLNNVEWTGVELRRVLQEAGVRPEASWVLAEGGDASRLARSVPLSKALDDALLVWAANGEPLRPAFGFPVRLLVPGWEANVSIKWLRRLELNDAPTMTRDETATYTDVLPGDRVRYFSWVMDAKSIVTSPSHPMVVTPGSWPISGLAWSGRGRIRQVDVSTDGGTTWSEAELLGTVTPKAAVRFQLPWTWNGTPASIMSRAVDETGYVQPTYRAFAVARGRGTDYHFNPIRSWWIDAHGAVTFVADPEMAS